MDLRPGEKLDYTFDFTALLAPISATIEGDPEIIVSPASPVILVGDPSIDDTTRKVSIVAEIPADSGDMEYSIICEVNATGTPDRVFRLPLVLRVRPFPVSGGYTTVERICTEYGITSESERARVSDYILEATAIIDRKLGRSFGYQAGIVERVAGYGSDMLMVSRTPLISVTSITYDGETVDADDYEIYDRDAGMINSDRWIFTGSFAENLSRTPQTANPGLDYTVTYNGGYVLPGQPGRTLPYDIERACIELVNHIRSGNIGNNVKSESVSGVGSVEYFSGEMPPAVEKLLAPYLSGAGGIC